MHEYNEEYYERGLITGKSLYVDYRWIPELSIRMAYFMVKKLGIKDDAAVLDFGCAKGFLVKALRLLGFNTWGMDISRYAIDNAPVEVRQYCYTAIFIDEQYNWIIAKNVFEHIPEPAINDTLRMLANCTKKMFAVIPLGKNNEFIIPIENKEPTHELAQTKEWWEKKFLECGFILEKFSYKFEGCKENYTSKWPEGNGFFELRSLKKKSDMEHQYTSTGSKLAYHKEALKSYIEGTGKTVVCTHVAPEGRCNLNCSYCSVWKRDKYESIPLEVIQKYITDLKTRGLKAVIIGGGGEPLLYPKINELVQWLKDQDLEIGLITNGTQFHTYRKNSGYPAYVIQDETIKAFSWIRISIGLPLECDYLTIYLKMNSNATLGYSFVVTKKTVTGLDGLLSKFSAILDTTHAKYLRLLPNCLLYGNELIELHKKIDEALKNTTDKRIFHQWKQHATPDFDICHQSYFRPFLSEVHGGTVMPCDSVILNNAPGKFEDKYALCKPEEILDYLDGKLPQKFQPKRDCTGCVFVKNNQILDKMIKTKIIPETMGTQEHANFI